MKLLHFEKTFWVGFLFQGKEVAGGLVQWTEGTSSCTIVLRTSLLFTALQSFVLCTILDFRHSFLVSFLISLIS